MKVFDDLVFDVHQKAPYFSTQAKLFFENGYGVSIVTGHGAYGDYEMAICKGDADNWEIDYTTYITDDVLGYLTPESITEYMKQVQELPNVNQPVHELTNPLKS